MSANRAEKKGVAGIFIDCVDGFKGFPDAIEAVFPRTAVQLCLVHMVYMVHHSLNFVGWHQRKQVAADLPLIYSDRRRGIAQAHGI